MLDERDFIDRVWEKYAQCVKDESKKRDGFFNRNLYRNMSLVLCMKMFSLMLVVIVFSMAFVGGTYAVIKNIAGNYEQLESKLNKDVTVYNYGKQGNEVMEMGEALDGDIYYKKIMSYDEYVEVCEYYGNALEMKREEFDDCFVILMESKRVEMYGLYADDVRVDDDTIYIDLKRKEETYDYENPGMLPFGFTDEEIVKYMELFNQNVFLKMTKDQNRGNIKISVNEKKPNMTKYSKNLEDFKEDYTIEQAIKDGCVVINNNKWEANSDKWYEFIKNARENNINDNIRVVTAEEGKVITITDLEYNDGWYIVGNNAVSCESDRKKEALVDNSNTVSSKEICYFCGTEYLYNIDKYGQIDFCIAAGKFHDRKFVNADSIKRYLHWFVWIPNETNDLTEEKVYFDFYYNYNY